MLAASYFTVHDEEFSSSDIRRMNRGCCCSGQQVVAKGFSQQTLWVVSHLQSSLMTSTMLI